MTISVRLGVAAAALLLIWAAPAPAISGQQAPASAQDQAADVDPVRLKSAREFIKATNVEKQIAETMPVMMRQILGGMSPYLTKNVPEEKQADLNAFLGELTEEINKEFAARQGELIDLMAIVYARVLTVEQMEAMAAFYTSPPGQKFVSSMPALMAETAPMIMKLMLGQPIEIDRNVDPAALAAAQDMMKASKSEKMFDTMMGQMADRPGMMAPPGHDRKAAEDAQKMIANLQSSFTARRGEMMELIATMWAKRFTIEEMQAVTEFYRTPHGEAVIDAMPALLAEQQRVTQSFYQGMFANISVKVKDMIMKRRSLRQ